VVSQHRAILVGARGDALKAAGRAVGGTRPKVGSGPIAVVPPPAGRTAWRRSLGPTTRTKTAPPRVPRGPNPPGWIAAAWVGSPSWPGVPRGAPAGSDKNFVTLRQKPNTPF